LQLSPIILFLSFKANGTCIRRLVWGHGPHIFYVDSLQVLRRKATTFLHHFIQRYLFQQQPHQLSYEHTLWYKNNNHQTVTNSSNNKNALLFVKPNGERMKMLVYTRGNSGKGRTMQDEGLLVNALQSYGANVFLCCDFHSMSLELQLLHAYYADVVRFNYSLLFRTQQQLFFLRRFCLNHKKTNLRVSSVYFLCISCVFFAENFRLWDCMAQH